MSCSQRGFTNIDNTKHEKNHGFYFDDLESSAYAVIVLTNEYIKVNPQPVCPKICRSVYRSILKSNRSFLSLKSVVLAQNRSIGQLGHFLSELSPTHKGCCLISFIL